jgi:hypothetical protein
MNIRLSLEDLKAFNRDEDAVELPDGSGYAGTLNVYHEIHCVVRCFFSFFKSMIIQHRLTKNSHRNGFTPTCMKNTTTPISPTINAKWTDYIQSIVSINFAPQQCVMAMLAWWLIDGEMTVGNLRRQQLRISVLILRRWGGGRMRERSICTDLGGWYILPWDRCMGREMGGVWWRDDLYNESVWDEAWIVKVCWRKWLCT